MSVDPRRAPSPQGTDARLRWAIFLPVVASAAGMMWWTWGTWPHLFVDFGRELYVPWRLVEGDTLYRDIAYFNGPLSPYWNALCFRIFGVGLLTLVLCNLALLGLLAWLLYDLLARISSPIAAGWACGFFVCVFAFGQIDVIGNDNYLTPYSHEVVHGLLLSLLAIRCSCSLGDRPFGASIGAGLALGLVFLTKAEVFLAAGVAVAAMVALLVADAARERSADPHSGVARSPDPAWDPRSVLLIPGAALLPPLLSLLLLSLEMPAGEALHGTLGSWTSVFDRALTGQHFYRATTGTLDPAGNLLRMLGWSVAWLVALAVPAGLALWLAGARLGEHEGTASEPEEARSRALPRLAALLTAALAFASLSSLSVDWNESTRALPPAMVALALLLFGELRRRWRSGEALDGLAPRLGLLVFSGVLLLKICLRVRVDQYGFALAMPATLVVVVALVDWVPAGIDRRGGSGWLPRAAALGALAAMALWFLRVQDYYVTTHRHPVAAGADRFFADERAGMIDEALGEIQRRLGPGQSLAVLPEGVMINYLARRVNPTGHINFMPPELIIFGEDEIVEAFRRAPPDFVLLTRKDTREYGGAGFGRDYGLALVDWIHAHYRGVARIGVYPLGPGSGSRCSSASMPASDRPHRRGGVAYNAAPPMGRGEAAPPIRQLARAFAGRRQGRAWKREAL
ncbi:MAG: glycosyltransferase family 39 protein [Deltaproteobacteria bacterium]|nr:glycosyltransferase family 39 protein [Deltaproteobacteria bacterium]